MTYGVILFYYDGKLEQYIVLVDRGVSYIGEISKSGLQTLMQSIVETARELKNL